MSATKRWQVLELLNTTVAYFTEKQIENPRLNAELLLGKALNMRRVDLYIAFERPVVPNELDLFRKMVKRRATGEPLQYILGETEFMGLPYKISPAALIPRPETEILVEEVLKLENPDFIQNPLIWDVGTGSGCIAVSLAVLWPKAAIVATDVSAEALKLAQENAALNKVSEKIRFLRHDIFTPLNATELQQVQIIAANPPYITKAEMPGLQKEVRDFEPQIALTDHGDGLRFYRRLLEIAVKSLKKKGGFLFMELSGMHPEKIIRLAEGKSFKKLSVSNDLNKIPRVLKIEV